MKIRGALLIFALFTFAQAAHAEQPEFFFKRQNAEATEEVRIFGKSDQIRLTYIVSGKPLADHIVSRYAFYVLEPEFRKFARKTAEKPLKHESCREFLDVRLRNQKIEGLCLDDKNTKQSFADFYLQLKRIIYEKQ